MMKNHLLLILLLSLPHRAVAMMPLLLFVSKEGIVTQRCPLVVPAKDYLIGKLVYDALPFSGKHLLATALYDVDMTKKEQSFCCKLGDKEIKVTVIPCVVQNKVLSYCVKQEELPVW